MVLLNETKSTPRINYIDDFIVALKEFYDYFPEYRGKKVVPIFASLYLQEEVINYLTKNRIYAMAIKEDTMDLLNFEDILPKMVSPLTKIVSRNKDFKKII